MMTVDQIRALQPGALVRALIPVSGGVNLLNGDEMEIELPAGAVATVHRVEHFGGSQGWAVSISFDNGIDNVFDEGDDGGAFALEPVADTAQTMRERSRFLIDHSPADYPMADLMGDLQRILEAPTAPTTDPAEGLRTEYRVLVRGQCTGVLTVSAVDEDEALEIAEAWTSGTMARRAIASHVVGITDEDCDFCDVEGLED